MNKSKIQIFIINLCHYTRFLKRIAKSFHNNVKFGSRDIKNFTSRLKQLKNVFGIISFKDFKYELEIEFTNKIFLGLDISEFSKIEEFKNTDIYHLHFANKLFKLYKDAYNENKFLASYCVINAEEVAKIFKAHHYCDDDYEEENNMNFTINEEKKVVTLVTQEIMRCPGLKDRKSNKVSMVKCHKEDDFDKYVGAALAYVYNEFGSKTAFRKWVNSHSKVVKKEEPKAKTIKSSAPRKEVK